MTSKKVLVVGSGGREHALARAFSRSARVGKVFVAPGNPGMTTGQAESDAPIECVPIEMLNIGELLLFARREEIDVTFAGPEVVLEAGIVDAFRDEGLDIVGPTALASNLECSKRFAKEHMQAAGVPTAAYEAFLPEDRQDALAYVAEQPLPVVLKQDGLAAGKGVVIAETHEEAAEAMEEMLDLGGEVIVEEFLEGDEFSFFTLVNGTHQLPLIAARDYKRAYDKDEGKNTGGMGAFAPVDFVTDSLIEEVHDVVVTPLMEEMIEAGVPYTGVLYSGMMLTADGLKVIEFNARFGDPETQIILPMIENDFYDVVEAHLKQEELTIELKDGYSLGIVMASDNYPDAPITGNVLHWEPDFPLDQVYFSGVAEREDGRLETAGGRVLMVTAQGDTLKEAHEQAYELIRQIDADETFYRYDIGRPYF